MPKIEIEGSANIEINYLIAVCAKCKHNEREQGGVEIDFFQRKIYYKCPKCEHLNEMDLSNPKPQPYPKARMMR